MFNFKPLKEYFLNKEHFFVQVMHIVITLIMIGSYFLLSAQQSIGDAQLIQTIDFKGAGGCPGLRLGDINGDGKYEIVVAQPVPQSTLDAHTPQEVARVTAFSLTGEILWQYTRPGNPPLTGHTASSDIPVQVYDLDGDGVSEVLANFGRTQMTILDGRTGKISRTIPLPQGKSKTGSSGANDCIIIANLRGTPWPQDFIVKTRYTQIWGIDGRNGDVLWTIKNEGDNLTHFGYAFDADNDGKDEYVAGSRFLDHDGKILWTGKNLTMHIDAVSVGELDGDTTNGVELILGSQVGVAFNARSGKELWRDRNVTSNGQGIQQVAMGDFDFDSPGREVVMVERIGPRTDKGRDANILVTANDKLLWKENRTGNDYGWLSVSERITNWDGTGSDQILSFRRTTKPPTIYDGKGKAVASFSHPGENIEFVMHADLCGDEREEVIVYNETTAWIFANGGGELTAPPKKASLPQNRRLYNWSVYSGWEAIDYTFYTPGSVTKIKNGSMYSSNTTLQSMDVLAFLQQGKPGCAIRVWSLQGKVFTVASQEWKTFYCNLSKGVYLVKVADQGVTVTKKIAVR